MAENIDVRIPKTWTTAKPLIGPVPNINSATPAISVVIFESNIVPQAFS